VINIKEWDVLEMDAYLLEIKIYVQNFWTDFPSAQKLGIDGEIK
jgi:hypothetical protein